MTAEKHKQQRQRESTREVRIPGELEYTSPAALRPNPDNARMHTPKQISLVAASIREFGFISAVIVDRDCTILAGHARVEAAKKLGLTTVPVLRVEHLTEEELRAFVLADNRLAEIAGWDRDILASELAELSALDLDFDIGITGFSVPEIDVVIESAAAASVAPSALDELLEPGQRAVTRVGDMWQVGKHRLVCGDTTQPKTFARLLGKEKAGIIFVDPPYNVAVNGHVSGLGKARHREFPMASGEMSEEEFTRFLTQTLSLHAAYSRDGALHYICMDWRHLRELLAAGEDAYDRQINLCVWDKGTGGMGSLYRSQHELVLIYRNGTRQHVNNVELGRHGRYRTNLWKYAGANSFGATREEDLATHPTVKPIQMVADAILDASRPGEIVLDGFAGSGTTLLAAHKVRRRGYGIELDPIYCDVILKRLAAATGEEAVHEESGLPFEQIAAERQNSDVEKTGDE